MQCVHVRTLLERDLTFQAQLFIRWEEEIQESIKVTRKKKRKVQWRYNFYLRKSRQGEAVFSKISAIVVDTDLLCNLTKETKALKAAIFLLQEQQRVVTDLAQKYVEATESANYFPLTLHYAIPTATIEMAAAML